MRRKQFMQLIADLRAELRKSSDPAVGVSDLPTLKQVLGRVYETLYDAHDWPHLRQMFPKIELHAGQRYYDFPEDTDYDKVERVVVWQNNSPFPATRGIDFEEYAQFDSNDDVRADPVSRWDVRYTSTREQMEVWPIPASAGYSIQFKGKLKFKPLVNDSDLCLLDDQLVVLHAAAELLPAAKQADAQIKLAAANSRLGITKARSKSTTPPVRVGLSRKSPEVLSRSVVRISGR